MSQKLILPINKCKLTASIKTAAYLTRFGYVHYGVDIVSAAGSATVYASGDGRVVAAGWDNVVGNVIAVRYNGARHTTSGVEGDLILRYFHLAKVSVKKGQVVDKDTMLGSYGRTGILNMSPHLHLEADSDVAYPLYSPTVGSSNFILGSRMGAHGGTMSNPLEWLHCKPSSPDYQVYTTAGNAYIRDEDKSIGMI